MRKYFPSFLLALLLHLGIIGLFMLSPSEETSPPTKKIKIPEIIEASIMDETLVVAKAQQLKQQQADKKRLQQQQKDTVAKQIKQENKRLQQAKDKRLQEEKLAKKQAEKRIKTAQEEQKKLLAIKQKVALEKKKQVLEKKRKAEAERVAKEERKIETAKKEAALKKAAKQKKIAAEKKRRENEENLKKAAIKQAEDNRIRAENAKIAKQATVSAVALITRKVTQNWNRPNTATGKLSCTIKVGLIPGGDVMSVSVIKSSGNALFDASVERAVGKASPLPVPKDPELFNRKFRNLTFVFAPN